MGLLEGRKALVFGVANDHSIAWGIAKAFHDEGAIVGFSSVESLIERRVRPLAESIGATFVEPADLQSDEQIRAVMAKWAASTARSTSSSTPSPTRSARTWTASFVDTSRDGFALALDVSAYSLVALTREARPYLHRGSSVITLTYYGAEKVVTHYNVMGVAKAALEASVRYLAADLGPGRHPRQRHLGGAHPHPVGRRHRGLPQALRPVQRDRARCARTSPSRTAAGPPSTWAPTCPPR